MHTPHTLACTNAMKHPASSTCKSCVAVSCQQHWVRWELREKRGKQAETEWKKGCRQHLYSAVLWPPKRPWKVLRWNQITVPLVFVNQRCWQAWVRPTRLLDRVRAKVCGGFQTHWKKSRGERFPLTQKPRNSLALRRSLVLLGGYFRCPSGVCPQCPPKRLTKDPEFLLDNKRICCLNHRGGVHKRNAGACAPLKGWLIMCRSQGGMLGKEQPFIQGPYIVVMVCFEASAFCQLSIVYVEELTKILWRMKIDVYVCV